MQFSSFIFKECLFIYFICFFIFCALFVILRLYLNEYYAVFNYMLNFDCKYSKSIVNIENQLETFIFV